MAGVRLSSSKSLSKSAFERRGVQTPRGGLATSGNLNVLTELDRQGVNRLVVKPDRGSGSTDVFADKNIEEAMDIILCRPNKSFVVEEYIEGHEFRVQLVAK